MKINTRSLKRVLLVVVILTVLTVNCFAATPSPTPNGTVANAGITDLTKPIENLINSLMTPLLGIVGALGSLYCVILGVKYAKAEEPQDREKAKQHLKNAVIGFVLIFVLLLALKVLTPALSNWVTNNELK